MVGLLRKQMKAIGRKGLPRLAENMAFVRAVYAQWKAAAQPGRSTAGWSTLQPYDLRRLADPTLFDTNEQVQDRPPVGYGLTTTSDRI